MSWQDKALAAFWADAFANEPLDSHRRIEAAIAAAAASLLPSTDAPMADNAITPPPELVRQWRAAASNVPASLSTDHGGRRDYIDYIATQAARWGSDQELEACCEWLQEIGPSEVWLCGDDLRQARRPKPPSLKEQALEAAQRFYAKGHEDCTDEEVKADFDTLCRALEQLDE